MTIKTFSCPLENHAAAAMKRLGREMDLLFVSDPTEADAIFFGGGSDVNPAMYNVKNVAARRVDDRRDKEEKTLYDRLDPGQVKIGICRGAQLLNVLNGGFLIQDADGHNYGTHVLFDLEERTLRMVNSYHHQIMVPTAKADLIAVSGASTYHKYHTSENSLFHSKQDDFTDPEVVHYPASNSFCFQFHPEYPHEDSRNYFTEILIRKEVI